MPYDWRTEWPGVFSRHADSCPVRNGHRCACGPLGYRASARDTQTGRRVLSPDFQTVAEARGWLTDQQQTLEAARGAEHGDGQLGSLIDDFVGAAENGLVRNPEGLEYQAAEVRELRDSLSYVDAQLGTMSLDDVRRRHVQAMVDELHGSGLEVERIRDVVAALRSLYTYALQRNLVDFSPVVQLSLPDGAKPAPPPAPSPSPSMNGHPTQPLPAAAMATAPMATAPLATAQLATAPIAVPPIAAPPVAAPPMAMAPMVAPPTAPATASMATAPAPAPHQSAMWTPGSLTPPQGAEPYRDALMPERVLWWTVLIIVVVAVLIAIVLAAESV